MLLKRPFYINKQRINGRQQLKKNKNKEDICFKKIEKRKNLTMIK